MRNLPKFLRENIPGIKEIPDKNIERLRKVCPKCGSVNIRFLSGNYTFRCENCKHRFTHPKTKMIKHDDGFCTGKAIDLLLKEVEK